MQTFQSQKGSCSKERFYVSNTTKVVAFAFGIVASYVSFSLFQYPYSKKSHTAKDHFLSSLILGFEHHMIQLILSFVSLFKAKC